MSVESQQLERSALERKDRDELQTIATALGGKPGSRAKKAEIVDLILQLAGVTSDDAPAATEVEAPAKPKRSRRGSASTADEAGSAGGDDESSAGNGAATAEAEAGAEAGAEAEATAGRRRRRPARSR